MINEKTYTKKIKYIIGITDNELGRETYFKELSNGLVTTNKVSECYMCKTAKHCEHKIKRITKLYSDKYECRMVTVSVKTEITIKELSKLETMSKITFYIGNKPYSFIPSFAIKQDGEKVPNNVRVATLLEEDIKKYKKRTKINGIPTNITIEDNTYIGTLKSFKDFFKLEMKRKQGYGVKF